MKKNLFIIPLLFAICSCRYDKGEVPTPDLNCVSDSVIHTALVSIKDYSFTPSSLTILSGDTVKWTYDIGADAHTTTCDGSNGSTLPSGGNTWDSGILTPMLPGDSFKTAIVVPGTYTYICLIHGASVMSGTIIVKPRCK